MQQIGIRLALGALSWYVQSRVLRETVMLALAAAMIGRVVSAGAGRMIESLR